MSASTALTVRLPGEMKDQLAQLVPCVIHDEAEAVGQPLSQ
jgi:hypothetical protein